MHDWGCTRSGSVQFSSVAQSCLTLGNRMVAAACQISLSITNSRSLLKLMSIRSVVQSNRLILCYPLFLLPSFFPRIRVFCNESVVCIRRPKYWSFSFSIGSVQFSLIAQSCLTLRPHGLQHTRLPCLSPTPGVYSDSCPMSWWCHPTVSSSVVPFFPPSIFPSIRVVSNESVLCIRWPKFGVSASTSVLPMNIQDWFSLGWTCWISLKFKALARIFFNPTVQKHQFFSVHLSLYPNSHPYMTTGKNHTFE